MHRKISRTCGNHRCEGTLSSIASLSFSQKQALTASWRLLRPQAPGLFRKVFLELEIVSSKVKQVGVFSLLRDSQSAGYRQPLEQSIASPPLPPISGKDSVT
ncbi:hypothetical protein ANCDUO_20341 [Ancylostoma duodenale]|uniref:Uncharacterized protein n=1 Tax=Ancylostoma duodenale TaxID=51022 RepID=A0A0C2FLU8_9BILA|nr:hypothetical protein ANCDUO_20341 [Ancylostoma duodenale]